MNSILGQAILQLTRLPDVDQDRIGRKLIAHIERLGALRTEIDKGIRSLEAGEGSDLSIEDFISEKNSLRRPGR